MHMATHVYVGGTPRPKLLLLLRSRWTHARTCFFFVSRRTHARTRPPARVRTVYSACFAPSLDGSVVVTFVALGLQVTFWSRHQWRVRRALRSPLVLFPWLRWQVLVPCKRLSLPPCIDSAAYGFIYKAWRKPVSRSCFGYSRVGDISVNTTLFFVHMRPRLVKLHPARPRRTRV
jgi:hypothetical protein